MNNLAVVVIGRNEAAHLNASLSSVKKSCSLIVYVDSGSTDESLKVASSLDVPVIQLDKSKPFSAARARNEGATYIKEKFPKVEFIQFLDGDCQLNECWLEKGLNTIQSDPNIAIVCGILQEVEPNRTLFTKLCSIEWSREIGETDSVGGIFIIRAQLFFKLGGFNEYLVAGEEPELCSRVKQKDKRILRIKQLMALHDSGQMMFKQWWARTLRNGVAIAQSIAPQHEQRFVYAFKNVLSIVSWVFILPIVLILSVMYSPFSLLLLLIYPLKVLHIYSKSLHDIETKRDRLIYSLFCIVGKLPEFVGIIKYMMNYLLKRQQKIVEHKLN